MGCESKHYACKAVCLYTQNAKTEEIAGELRRQSEAGLHHFALVFFSKSAFPGEAIVALMAENAPHLHYAACTTAGEITPSGLVDGELLILLFPASHFNVSWCHVGSRKENTLPEITSRVSQLKDAAKARQAQNNNGGELHTFAMCLMDGMSYQEEVITAALHWALDDIPLLGGSAGDNLNFKETRLILNGEILDSRAIVLIFQSKLPVQIFKTENFVPTDHKLVVTRSDPDNRIVYEFNGGPAGEVYAELIGSNPADLAPQSFASHPLVVRVGGEYYCRSIQRVNDDGSLTFFCAIDDGIVLTVAQPTGMGNTTKAAMKELHDKLGKIDFVLGFDCVLRQVDARNRQITRKISDIYCQNNVIGFNTYGEQYQSMHLNQTFTGIAFGMAQEDGAEQAGQNVEATA